MTATPHDGFSAAERAAMKERAQELKTQGQGADGETDALEAIDKMPADEQALAFAFHELVREVAPGLVPRTWYGMPAYATAGKRGKIVCFFAGATKNETRYNEVGFTDTAALDNGSMWPTAFAIQRWTVSNEKKLRSLVQKAAAPHSAE